MEWWNMPQCGRGSVRMRTRGNHCVWGKGQCARVSVSVLKHR